ncbi:HIT family protein [Virgibacillus sp. C22-A2]|uniref:HIT family protein n=1 Tax=Virgibacillus tibetensis TaxID=3042313 RepID=A0ABU6KH21_9BACI|nr:HIT family protein [Virgibacillus sp. C22-A2]
METCIFCQIISKKSEAYIIYEDDLMCCFLDKFPINTGHVLVVPKKHYPEFRDVDTLSLHAIMEIAQKVTIALEDILDTDGITVMQNNGMFKDVEHYHMHIIPRFQNDGFSWNEPNVMVASNTFSSLKDVLQGYLLKSSAEKGPS